MRIAVLIKQVPAFESLSLGPDGRLVRDHLPLELNPYCRRAVTQGVELAGQMGGSCLALTLGPPTAEDCLREAIAWGCDRGVLVSDPAFAGSDTIATARALARALQLLGRFDLVLVGRNSVDADTGQVGPQVAELCGLSFAGGVKELAIDDDVARVRCEEDDGYSDRVIRLPAVLSCAERLCEPAKVDPAGRAAVDAARITRLDAADLGPGPWGQDASGTVVGEVRLMEVARDRLMLEGPLPTQVAEAVTILTSRGALEVLPDAGSKERLGPPRGLEGPAVVVAVEPGRAHVTRELLGAAVRLAEGAAGTVTAVVSTDLDPDLDELSSWGADAVVAIRSAACEADVAASLCGWAADAKPWAILLPSTAWGREVGSRVAATLGAGLTGDAVGLDVEPGNVALSHRLVAWKPAFGGQLLAAIRCTTDLQMATVRAGVLAAPPPRDPHPVPVTTLEAVGRHQVTITSSVRDDDIDALAMAQVVIGVGAGVTPDDYPIVEALATVLDAEIAATRKVTDRAWLPRARQVGITGRSIQPRLYVAVGLSGKFNHSIGVRAAGTVLAINTDPGAPIWDHADVGILGDWREVVPLLAAALPTLARSPGGGR